MVTLVSILPDGWFKKFQKLKELFWSKTESFRNLVSVLPDGFGHHVKNLVADVGVQLGTGPAGLQLAVGQEGHD